MYEPTLTIVGNLTADPEVRYGARNGTPLGSLTIACTPKNYDRETQRQVDGETTFMRCNLVGELAEHAADGLQKGVRVLATGRLKSRSYDTRDGEKRTIQELEVDALGPDLRFQNVRVRKAERSTQQQPKGHPAGGGTAARGGYTGPPAAQPATDTPDPWTPGQQQPIDAAAWPADTETAPY